jgi:hypothetical protein
MTIPSLGQTLQNWMLLNGVDVTSSDFVTAVDLAVKNGQNLGIRSLEDGGATNLQQHPLRGQKPTPRQTRRASHR